MRMRIIEEEEEELYIYELPVFEHSSFSPSDALNQTIYLRMHAF